MQEGHSAQLNEALTRWEMDVLRLLAEGLSNREIAAPGSGMMISSG